ncbi:MAG: ABC transporter permease, partial [Methanococcaceae archaeon]
IMGAVILGFGRAISEVGVSILIGGNIRGLTRTFTTAISLETSRGNLVLSIALGFILLSLALIINFLLNYVQGKD